MTISAIRSVPVVGPYEEYDIEEYEFFNTEEDKDFFDIEDLYESRAHSADIYTVYSDEEYEYFT